jgi:hypothetical protein
VKKAPNEAAANLTSATKYDTKEHQVGERGLDDRERDESGRIRVKSGAAKMGNLAKKYPELKVFSPNATLSGIRKRYGVESIEEARKLAREKLAGKGEG